MRSSDQIVRISVEILCCFRWWNCKIKSLADKFLRVDAFSVHTYLIKYTIRICMCCVNCRAMFVRVFPSILRVLQYLNATIPFSVQSRSSVAKNLYLIYWWKCKKLFDLLTPIVILPPNRSSLIERAISYVCGSIALYHFYGWRDACVPVLQFLVFPIMTWIYIGDFTSRSWPGGTEFGWRAVFGAGLQLFTAVIHTYPNVDQQCIRSNKYGDRKRSKNGTVLRHPGRVEFHAYIMWNRFWPWIS